MNRNRRKPCFRPRLETLEARCTPTFSLGIGERVFWDGEYIDRAVQVPNNTGDPELNAIPLGEHYDYEINVTEAGAHQLRVGLDVVFGEFRGFADPLFYDPGGNFWLQILNDYDADGKLEEVDQKFLINGAHSTEIRFPSPAPGEYIVRVTPCEVYERSFRMRAKLEPTPIAFDEPRLLLPNMRITAPFEPTFITPTTTFSPGVWVPGQPNSSYMADELASDNPPPGTVALRFSAGVENAGRGPLWLVYSEADTPEEMLLKRPAYQQVKRSDGVSEGDRYVMGTDGHWHACVPDGSGNWQPPDGVEPQSAGEFEFHATHGHYHYQGIYTYQLWSVDDPQAKTGGQAGLDPAGDGHKLGFAPSNERMADWFRFFQDEPAGIPPGAATLLTGWSDIYDWNRTGQYVNFPVNADGTPVAGYYLIRGIADMDNKIIESNERDNTSYTYIRVENTATGPKITVLERGYGTDPWDSRKVVDGPLGNSSNPDDVIIGQVALDTTPNENPPRLSISDVTMVEGAFGMTAVVFTVRLSRPSDAPVTFNFATRDGTAQAGSDYQAKSGTLTFAPGETVKTITVWVLSDLSSETNETFSLDLTGALNADVLDGWGIATIVNDDL